MGRDEERRVEERGPVGEEEGRDAVRKSTESDADDRDAAGTEDPAFYLKPSDGD